MTATHKGEGKMEKLVNEARALIEKTNELLETHASRTEKRTRLSVHGPRLVADLEQSLAFSCPITKEEVIKASFRSLKHMVDFELILDARREKPYYL
jgi:hypothetical protein